MPKYATVAADNVFYKARMDAVRHNELLCSREGVCELTGFDRGRMYRIETDKADPYPEEVARMAELYNAPHLQNYYCSRVCPLGRGNIISAEFQELQAATLQLVSKFRNLTELREGLIDIAVDGVIDEKERPRMEQYMEMLEEMEKGIQTLKMFCRKQFGEEQSRQ